MNFKPRPSACQESSGKIEKKNKQTILVPSFSLPDVLCNPTELIWRKGTPFEAMTGRTAPSSHGLLAEAFWDFSQL